MCQLAKGEALPVATPHKHTQTTFRCTQHQSGSLSFPIFPWGESKNPWLSDAKSCGLRGCGASAAEGQADWEGERGKEDFSPDMRIKLGNGQSTIHSIRVPVYIEDPTWRVFFLHFCFLVFIFWLIFAMDGNFLGESFCFCLVGCFCFSVWGSFPWYLLQFGAKSSDLHPICCIWELTSPTCMPTWLLAPGLCIFVCLFGFTWLLLSFFGRRFCWLVWFWFNLAFGRTSVELMCSIVIDYIILYMYIYILIIHTHIYI